MTLERFDDYQQEAMRTAGDVRLEILGLGIAGEAGEVADLLKKVCGHGHPIDHARLAKELGDVLWYAAVLANKLGIRLSDVAELNISKLRARYPNGFSTEASLRRRDGES